MNNSHQQTTTTSGTQAYPHDNHWQTSRNQAEPGTNIGQNYNESFPSDSDKKNYGLSYPSYGNEGTFDDHPPGVKAPSHARNLNDSNGHHGSVLGGNEPLSSHHPGRNAQQQEYVNVGSSDTPVHTNDSKSYATTKNIGEPLKSGNGQELAGSSKYAAKDTEKTDIYDRDTRPQSEDSGKHRRKSSFNKHAIMATLGLGGKSDSDKSKKQQEESNSPTKHTVNDSDLGKEHVSKHQSQSQTHRDNVQDKYDYGNFKDKEAKDARTRVAAASVPANTHSSESQQSTAKHTLKSATSETQYNRSVPQKSMPSKGINDATSEPLVGNDYALKQSSNAVATDTGISRNTGSNTTKEQKFSAIDATDSQNDGSYGGSSGQQNQFHNTSQYVNPNQFDTNVFEKKNEKPITGDSSHKNAQKHTSQDMQGTYVDNNYVSSRAYEGTSHTLDPNVKHDGNAAHDENTADSGLWSSVMGAVGLRKTSSQSQKTGSDPQNEYGLEQDMGNTHISDTRGGASNKSNNGEIKGTVKSKGIPALAEKNSIPPTMGAALTAEDLKKKSGNVGDSHDNQIPGTFSSEYGGNSKSLVDPDKNTYSTENAYTSSDNNRHTRNVSVDEQGNTDRPTSEAKSHGLSQHEEGYQYDTKSGVPRSVQQKETHTTDENGNVVNKISNTIKSTLH